MCGHPPGSSSSRPRRVGDPTARRAEVRITFSDWRWSALRYRRLRWGRGYEVTSQDVIEFGGWPRPPRWVWAVAGLAVVALLVGVVVARTRPHHRTASSSAAAATVPVPGGRMPEPAPVAFSPPAQGACGPTIYPSPMGLAQTPAAVPVRVNPSRLGCCVQLWHADGTVQVWHADGGSVVAFSPDGKPLGTGGPRLITVHPAPPTGGTVPSPVCLPGPTSARVP